MMVANMCPTWYCCAHLWSQCKLDQLVLSYTESSLVWQKHGCYTY